MDSICRDGSNIGLILDFSRNTGTSDSDDAGVSGISTNVCTSTEVIVNLRPCNTSAHQLGKLSLSGCQIGSSNHPPDGGVESLSGEVNTYEPVSAVSLNCPSTSVVAFVVLFES